MDQSQNSWQTIADVVGQKLTGEDNLPPPPKIPQTSTEITKPSDLPIQHQANPEAAAPAAPILTIQNLALLEKLTKHLAETAVSLSALVEQIKNVPQFAEHLKADSSVHVHAENLTSQPLQAEHISAGIQQTGFSGHSFAESSVARPARVLEGVFDGTRMVGADGMFYPVPPNYASKSKLVEGDLLKLTITPNGSFIYKQIGPAKRKRLIGELIKRQDGDTILYDVLAEEHVYHVLSAAVTYYKGEHGDSAAILAPSDVPSKWAAVEYIVKGLPPNAISAAK